MLSKSDSDPVLRSELSSSKAKYAPRLSSTCFDAHQGQLSSPLCAPKTLIMLTRTLSRSLPHAGNARRALATNAYMRSTEKMESVLDRLAQHRACAVLRTPTAEAAPKAMNAAIDGGFKLVEFTLTTPGCLDCVSDFRAKQGDTVMVSQPSLSN